jgi:hypothetical protein
VGQPMLVVIQSHKCTILQETCWIRIVTHACSISALCTVGTSGCVPLSVSCRRVAPLKVAAKQHLRFNNIYRLKLVVVEVFIVEMVPGLVPIVASAVFCLSLGTRTRTRKLIRRVVSSIRRVLSNISDAPTLCFVRRRRDVACKRPTSI